MVSITACPNCSEDVTIPKDLPAETSVRCPLCESQFPLTDVADSSRQVIYPGNAPALEPVDQPDVEFLDDIEDDSEEDDSDPDTCIIDPEQQKRQAEEELVEEPVEAETAETEADDEEPELEEEDVEEESESGDEEEKESEEDDEEDETSDAPLGVRCPCCEAEFPLDRLLVAATGEPINENVVAAIASDGSGASDPRFDFDFQTNESSESTDGAFDFAANDESSDEESPSLATAKGKRKDNEKSMARELFGVFVGGAVGLSIMYYALNFFGGEQFDMAKVYLPGVQHTIQHQPDWWPNWLEFGSDDEESSPNDQDDSDLDPTAYGSGGGLV